MKTPLPITMANTHHCADDLGEQNKLYDEIWTQIKAK